MLLFKAIFFCYIQVKGQSVVREILFHDSLNRPGILEHDFDPSTAGSRSRWIAVSLRPDRRTSFISDSKEKQQQQKKKRRKKNQKQREGNSSCCCCSCCFCLFSETVHMTVTGPDLSTTDCITEVSFNTWTAPPAEKKI